MSRSIRSFALLGVFGVLIGAAVIAARAADAAKPNTLTADEIADGWLLLFDGESIYGWTPSSKADWKVTDGVISVSSGEKGLLCTTCQWADYVFKVDFRAPAATNSGVFLRTPKEPKDPKSDCYELNIATPEVSPFFTGSFVGREKSSVEKFDESWHTFEVTADKGRLIVKLDGREVLDYTDPQPVAKGHIGLQFNSGKVEFRNVKLKPQGHSSIFNGKDLGGWKVVEARDRQKSRFTVTEAGEINVKNGPGALESEGRYGDFVLQFDVLSNGKHLLPLDTRPIQ
jgi:3-keto-disaccharide hydrolase